MTWRAVAAAKGGSIFVGFLAAAVCFLALFSACVYAWVPLVLPFVSGRFSPDAPPSSRVPGLLSSADVLGPARRQATGVRGRVRAEPDGPVDCSEGIGAYRQLAPPHEAR